MRRIYRFKNKNFKKNYINGQAPHWSGCFFILFFSNQLPVFSIIVEKHFIDIYKTAVFNANGRLNACAN
ncbi:hypothetical protein C0V77_13600 [Emticicia sp. TH156]|nr:hypothetical protein C0V77_13600 [Emticicia sp. TH156]